MIKVEFKDEDIEIFHHERFHNDHPRVRIKMEVLWLKSQGLSHSEIGRLTRLCQETIVDYLREYMSGGTERLKTVRFNRPKSELEAFKQEIVEEFKAIPPATIKEASHRIEKKTGLKRSETQVRNFLRKLGMKFRKAGSIPAKQDAKKQEEFKKEKLEPEIEKAKKGVSKLFFVDAAHFVLAPFLGFLWCFFRIFIKAPSGRSRFNVLGALNPITQDLITVTNNAYINAPCICQLFEEIRKVHSTESITLVMDNARYQKCKLVFDAAEKMNIQLMYLPSYSPNLNLIERLWKFVKRKCLYCKFYESFSSFSEAIKECLNKIKTEYREEIKSLITLNFQTFEKSDSMS